MKLNVDYQLLKLSADLKYFKLLKEEIAQKLRATHPSAPEKIVDWKVKDIADFQSDLEEKVNGRVSEKWVYTHLKGDSKKLPREDMLDLLAQYLQYTNWQAYVIDKSTETKSSKRYLIVIGIAVMVGMFCALVFMRLSQSTQCKICFVDGERNALVLDSPVKFYLHEKGTSPHLIAADSNTCVQFKTSKEQIQFSIQSPYYKTDTIIRNLVPFGDQFSEEIRLTTNDYALMIHIFSSSKIEDWKRRRSQLDQMIADDAQIYQIFEEENMILDLYNKWDFIDKLTTPTRSLKNIHVINTEYKSGKIQTMRFKQINTP